MSPRSQQRVDRRRRALVDEVRNDTEVARPRIYRGDSSGPTQRYNRVALDAINAPIAKYIPLRPFSMVVWFLTGLVPILGLLLLDSYSWQLERVLGESATLPFRLSEAGSLMAWLSCVTFGFAVAVMLGTYSVRRHRRDDYRGNFTVWRWAIPAAVLVSVDTATGFHNTFQAVCEFITRSPLWGDGSIWWISVWAIAFGGMLIRLMFEMASSRLAVGWALGALCCYACSAIVELGMTPTWISHYVAETSKLTTLMMGHHLVLFSLVTYSREVVLEAMGLVDSPAVRRAKAEAAKAEKQAAKAKEKQATSKDSAEEAPPLAASQPVADRDDSSLEVAKEQSPRKSKKKASRKSKKHDPIPTSEPKEEAPSPVENEVEHESDSPTLRAVSPPEESDSATGEFAEYRDEYDEYDDYEESPEAPQSRPELTIHGMDDAIDERKLSKAERRRLRKEQRRKKRAA